VQMMSEIANRRYPAPDNEQLALLRWLDMRFRDSPFYCSLTLNGMLMPDRIFGDVGIWSDDSCYFAAQEWSPLDSNPFITYLVLFDVVEMRTAKISSMHDGYIKPTRFAANSIIYVKDTTRALHEFEIQLDAIKNWKAIEA